MTDLDTLLVELRTAANAAPKDRLADYSYNIDHRLTEFWREATPKVILTLLDSEETLRRERAEAIAMVEVMAEALRDMLGGWKYIRESHGDLYGVGWDRAQNKAEEALALTPSAALALHDAGVLEKYAAQAYAAQLEAGAGSFASKVAKVVAESLSEEVARLRAEAGGG